MTRLLTRLLLLLTLGPACAAGPGPAPTRVPREAALPLVACAPDSECVFEDICLGAACFPEGAAPAPAGPYDAAGAGAPSASPEATASLASSL
jgi:hypothetical protein